MTQVVQTVQSFQTSAGPSLEAHLNDPALGDVRVVVTGRAGEVVQAQLIVQNRGAADALVHAAAAIHSAGDALAGVSVTVRAESGGSWTAGGRGGNPFEATGWTGGAWNSGSGGGAGNSSNSDRPGPGLANQSGAGNGSGNGAGAGQGTGTGASADGSRQPARPPIDPIIRPSSPTGGSSIRQPLPGGSQGDHRSPLDIRA